MTDASSRRQQRAAATSEQLLAAAREVFERNGYVATTVGAITEAANTAHGTFYLYFKNKEDVFAKVMEQVTTELFQQAQAPWGGEPLAALTAAIRGYLQVYASHKGLWRCLFEGMHQSPALGQMWLEGRRPFIERLERNLARQVAAGTVREVDPTRTAAVLGAMVEWATFCFVELGSPPSTTIDEMAETLADLWFHALYAAVD